METGNFESNENSEIVEHPRICCIDLDTNTLNKLNKIGTNIYCGTLGAKIKVSYPRIDNKQTLLLNHDFPLNLHEYDVTIVDLEQFDTIDYKSEEHTRDILPSKSAMYILSTYPQTIFDPRPFGSYILGTELKKIGNRGHLLIIFSSKAYTIEYEPIEITPGSHNRLTPIKHNIYSLLDYPPLETEKYGQEITICKIKDDFKCLLEKYFSKKANYNQTFTRRTKWINGEYRDDDNFIPLMTNLSGEIISFLALNENLNIIIFPQIKNKTDFLFEFMSTIAPSLFPELFPFSTTFAWKDSEEYWLPNHSNLLKLENDTKKEFELKLSDCKKNIDENRLRFSFLHQIITETGDLLVKSVIQFLSWLGYTNVIDFDATVESKILEEDIQIEIPEGLLIIECKGIGGTSTDSDCSQISKIKHRRCKERGRFDVYALFLVNHQRYLPPIKRQNPPFTHQQIQDAKNDERGLLTTWQLFTLYFDIENGICSKEEAKECLLDFGLISFKPKNLTHIYDPVEFFNNGMICIIRVDGILLEVNDEVLIEKDGKFEIAHILDIQLNGQSINQASSGEFGLKLDKKIRKNSILWKKTLTNMDN